MTCIVTIKGKKFYKDDFIHMVLDTMKITPEEIATNEYLQKINYSSNFGMGDPLGIRKKPEEKDPVKDVVKGEKGESGKKEESNGQYVSLSTSAALDRGNKKAVVTADENGKPKVEEQDWTREDALGELYYLKTLAERGRLTPEIFQSSYFGQSTPTNVIGEILAHVKSDQKGFIQELESHFDKEQLKSVEPSVVSENNVVRPKTIGHEGLSSETKFTSQVSKPFTYKVIEESDLHPSHLPSGERNPQHHIANAQPKERNDMASKLAQDKIAENPNFVEVSESPNAFFGAPIVNEHGEVIQGNNRSIGLKKHYTKGGSKYKEDLISNAEKFGLTKEQVTGMKNPILVRELKVSDSEAISLGQHDVKDIETGGKQHIDPIATSRKIKPQDKSKLTAVLFGTDYVSIKEAVRQNASKVSQILNSYLNPAQRKNTFNAEGEFTAKGMDDVSALVTHFLFEDGPSVLPEIFDGIPDNIKKGLQKSLPHILSLEKGKSLIEDTQNALLALHEYKASNSGSFADWVNTHDLFKNGTPKDVFTPTELHLARELDKARNQSEIKRIFQKHEELVNGTPANLMEEAVKGVSKEEAIKEQFKIDYNENRKNNKSEGHVKPESKNSGDGAVPEAIDPNKEKGGTQAGVKEQPASTKEVGGDVLLKDIDLTGRQEEFFNKLDEVLHDKYGQARGRVGFLRNILKYDLPENDLPITRENIKSIINTEGIAKTNKKTSDTPESDIKEYKLLKKAVDDIYDYFEKRNKPVEQSIKETPDTTPPEKPLNEPVNKAKTPIELAKEKYLAAKEKANKLRDQSNLGTVIDPFKKVKDQAIADRETLDMLVNLIIEHIKEGNRNIKEFAASIGEKVEDIKKAWDIAEKGEVYGIKVAMLDDAVRDALHDFGDRRTLDEVRLESIRKVVAGEIIPKDLVDKINSREKYIPSGEDILALIEYKVSLENERTKYKKELDNATTDKAKSVAQDKLNNVNDRLFDWSKASSISAADMSQGFRFRQLMMDNEFNAVNEIRQWKANDKNGEIPQEMVELIKKNEQEIKDLNDQLKDLEVKTKEKEEQWAIERMKAEAEMANKKAPVRKSSLSPEKAAELNQLASKFSGRFRTAERILADFFDAEWRRYALLTFEEMGGDFKLFSKAIISNVGKKIAPFLREIYKESGGTDQGIFGAYKPEMKTDKSGASKLVIPHNLIRALVESGIDNIEGITTAVHNMVKGDLPGITETQVRDAITEYGKKRFPNPDVIEGKIRVAKEIGKLLSSKELLGKGLNALRSGFQRDKPTPQARALMKEIRKMQKLLPKTETDIKNAWATALDKAKNSLKNQIEDLDNAITTGVALIKSDGTKLIPDGEIMELTERRDLLKEIYDATFGKEASELTESERIDAAIAALERDSEKLVTAIKKGQIEYKKTKPLGLAKRLDQARAKNKLIKEVLADLRKESGISLAKEIELRKDAGVKYILKQRERIKNKDFGTTKREEFFSDDPEWLNIQKQKRKIKEDFEVQKEIHRLNNMNFYEKAGMYALDAVGTLPKVMSLGLDLSAAFIQGLPNVMRKEWRTAFNKQFEFLAKEKNYNEWLANLRSSSFYDDWVVRHKLFVSEQGLKQRARDESFNSPLFDLTVGKIPVVGGAYRATERAFVGFGNVARVERFRRQVQDQLDLGFSPEKVHEWADDLAKITNNEYGRANYAKWAEGGAGIYASLLTAPRYVLSLFNTTMNPLYFAKLKGPARTQAIVHWFRMAGIVSGTMLAIKAANKVNSDIDIITDPNSNDFGKIVYKGLYMDGLSKLVQFPRLATQLLSGYTTNSATGEKTELDGGFMGKSRLSILGRYLWGKTAPVPNLGISALNGSDLAGDKVGPKNLGGLITPLSAKTIYEIAKLYEYQTAAAAAIPILFGQGVSARPDVRVINEYTLDAEMERMKEIKNAPFETTAAKEKRLKKEKIKEKNKEQSFINAARKAGRESEYRKLKKDVEKKQEENK